MEVVRGRAMEVMRGRAMEGVEDQGMIYRWFPRSQ
jgi:hypothetical protein